MQRFVNIIIIYADANGLRLPYCAERRKRTRRENEMVMKTSWMSLVYMVTFAITLDRCIDQRTICFCKCCMVCTIVILYCLLFMT